MKLLILITILLFCSCSGSKSIKGTKWYRGHSYYDENGTLVESDPKHKFSLFK